MGFFGVKKKIYISLQRPTFFYDGEIFKGILGKLEGGYGCF
jgi:hypothetical protein